MNEKIKLLAVTAWKYTSDETAYLNRIHNRTITQDEITDIFEQKFSELIVKECAKLADNCPADYLLQPNHYPSTFIKEHFGVKE